MGKKLEEWKMGSLFPKYENNNYQLEHFPISKCELLIQAHFSPR